MQNKLKIWLLNLRMKLAMALLKRDVHIFKRAQLSNFRSLWLTLYSEFQQNLHYFDKGNDFLNKLSYVVSAKLLGVDKVDEEDFINDYFVFISHEVNENKNRDEVLQCIRNDVLIKRSLGRILNKPQSDSDFVDIGASDINDAKLSTVDVNKIYRKYNHQNRDKLLNIRKNNRISVRAKQVRNWQLPPFDTKIVSTYLGLFSILIGLAGYLYNRIFYLFFNVNIGNYFTIQDYLATSLDRLSYGIFWAIVSLLFSYAGFKMGVSTQQFRQKSKFASLSDKFLWNLMKYAFLILFLRSLYNNLPFAFLMLPFTITLITMDYQISLLYMLTKSTKWVSLGSWGIFYLMILLCTPAADASMLVAGEYQASNKYIIHTTSQRTFTQEDSSVLSITARFILLYDRENNSVIVLPVNSIKEIDMLDATSTSMARKYYIQTINYWVGQVGDLYAYLKNRVRVDNP